MNISLKNKTALITGGSSGIGLATAKLFAEVDCSVIILARRKNKLEKAIKQLKRDSFQKHSYISADLRDIDNISTVFQKFFKKTPIDILINNSSGPSPKNIFRARVSDYLTVFNQHFLSANEISVKAIGQMKKRKYGRIINVLGTSILEPIPGLSLSSVKSITANWTKILSREVGEYNITVNNVLPGPTYTPELKKLLEIFSERKNIPKDEYLESVKKEIDLKRIAEPQEIANLLLFLASEYSSYITGSNIKIDGGYSKGI